MGLRRHLINPDHPTAECPDWYSRIKQAQYLNCKPWELGQQSILWEIWASVAMQAEYEAQEAMNERNKSK